MGCGVAVQQQQQYNGAYLRVVGRLFDDFGRHPEGCADERVAFAGGVSQLAGHSEIGQFDVALLAEQHVGSCPSQTIVSRRKEIQMKSQ